MKRNEFLSALSISAGTIIFVPFLASCSREVDESVPGGVLDFTLDLSEPSNASLKSNGGSLLKSGVIVARTAAGEFIAVAAACTHEGYTLQFDSANNRFHCANHGSNFSTTGSVLLGPASQPLKKYNIQLSGNSLRIYG